MNKNQLTLSLLLVVVLVTIALQIMYFGSDLSWLFLLILLGAYVISRKMAKKK